MKFFAAADLELNQKAMKFQLCGGAETLMGALTECLRNLRKFEYEGQELPAATSEDSAQRWLAHHTAPRSAKGQLRDMQKWVLSTSRLTPSRPFSIELEPHNDVKNRS